MSDDLESPCSSETVQPELPFFTPPPLDDVLSGIDNLNVPVDTQIPPPTDGRRPTYREPSALSLPLSSEPTDSTGLTEDIHNTEYSFDSYLTYSTTDYPSLFDVALRDILRDHECNYIDPQHVSVLPDTSTFPDSSSSGTQLLQHDHVVEPVKAPAQPQAENGPYGPPEGISPHCLYTAFQIPPHGVPTDPPVDAALTTKDFTGPIRTKPTCRECGRVFDRRSNLKAHEETHNPNRERRFVCPVTGCEYPFTRSHDRKRHLKKKHGVWCDKCGMGRIGARCLVRVTAMTSS